MSTQLTVDEQAFLITISKTDLNKVLLDSSYKNGIIQ